MRTWKTTTILLAAAALVGASVAPAFAHASFASSSAFGFAPNTMGGTGATGSSPPYPANSQQTLYTRVPFEQTDPYNGSDDTTVDVKIIVPDGWTSPACGPAQKQINDASTNSTNQPGDPVAGWTCELLDVSGRKVVHYSGPQVVAPATAADSPQFFTFTVVTPSPSVQTTYNGTNGTEGFIVDQTYASGEIEHWIPNAAFPGTTPSGATTTVATGLARTVAAPATGQADGSPGSETITATVPATEEFSMSIPTNGGVNLTLGTTSTYYGFSGNINSVVVTDTRSAKPAWSVTGQISDFAPGAISGKYLGWTPSIAAPGAGAVAGPAVPSGFVSGNGLRTASVLANAPAGHDIGSATLTAALDLRFPTSTPPGSYSGVLTLTAI
ncbi:MAG TPA: hypothetical protein VHC63_12110 [Acidimicrobiales bacterium]|nr:hypothetical protein [Acidimicrobiales bacterium]